MIKFTNNVRCAKSAIIVAAVANARQSVGLPGDCYVTSMNDSLHMEGSKHYTDDAVDFRTRDLSTGDVQAWASMCRRRLGRQYQVIVEKDHLHVEFDPGQQSGVV